MESGARQPAVSPLAGLRTALQAHREFVLILVLAVAFRLLAVLVFRPGGYLGEMSDFGFYRLLLGFTSQGYYPLVDFWVEYPPAPPAANQASQQSPARRRVTDSTRRRSNCTC